jgi:hypothetical protein
MEEGFNFTPILIPLIALLVGWAIGFFDSNMRTSKKIKQAEDSAKAAREAAENMIAQAQANQASPTDPSFARDDPGLFRIKNENGRLTLDLDGVRVNTAALTAEQRRRLVEMLNAIRPWLEGKPASLPTSTHLPQPSPASVPVVPPPTQPAALPQKSAAKTSSSSIRPDEEPEAVPTSIVGQINMILQHRIVNTPLASKGVTLMESITGGVNVYVGVQRYEAIDDVPDEEVRTAIRAAIAEWEKKYTPGL